MELKMMTLDCRCMGRESQKGLLLPILQLFFPLQGYPFFLIIIIVVEESFNTEKKNGGVGLEFVVGELFWEDVCAYKGVVANNSASTMDCGTVTR